MPMALTLSAVAQQMLVQWCMAAQIFSEPAFRQAVGRVGSSQAAETDDEVCRQEEIQPIVEQINSSMAAFSLELRSCMDQTSGERMWSLVNTNADDMFKAATKYTPNELAMLKALVEGIFTDASGNYAMALHDALRLGSSITTVSRTEAEALVRRFSRDGWLDDKREGFVVLGSRAIIELQSVFNLGFGDYVRLCSLCKEMATRGLACSECLEAVVHPYCAERVAEASGQLTCPACHQRIRQPRRFGPGERGVPHSAPAAGGGEKNGSDAEESDIEQASEEPATQSIKRLRINDDDDDDSD
ncbi:hypothetical protein GGI02_005156 [Coemansia sp. RSA 2322]|nr:hypothetical protein GGI02_005156 [Coemansia sp. RSA 2322]